MNIAEIVFPIPLDKSFFYKIPDNLQPSAIINRRVIAPFGSRKLTGYCISIKENFAEASVQKQLKEICEVIDEKSVVTDEMNKMAVWLSKTYLCSIGEALSVIVPVSLKVPKRKEKQKIEKLKNKNPNFKITTYQQTALEKITSAINKKQNINFLLHGVTGSGKTEIYLRSIQTVLQQNKTAIFLLPEIALTPQFIKIIKERFGNIFALWHSEVTLTKKYKIFDSIQKGQTKIVIGARSAIFLPFTNLGIIIIDEEHETTYKQNNKPCYDAKEIALWRAKYNNAVCVFGSATPALASYKKCLEGSFKLIELPERIDSKPLPKIEMVSLKNVNLKDSVLSKKVISAIKQSLARREQVIIFLNRRGFSSTIMCQKCDSIYQCLNCSVSMVYHKHPEILKCHYCGNEIKFPVKCQKCGYDKFRIFGVGTQRVEEELKKLFPFSKIFRLDADTATSKDVYRKVYEGVKNEEYDILLGTQMVAKGFDFSRVSLVCVVDADTSLYLPDFSSSEKTFQLITQVAGRCGRADIKGKVLVQTNFAQNYALVNAKNYSYKNFYEQETAFRNQLQYPPFCDLAKVTVRNKDDKQTQQVAQKIFELLEDKILKLKYQITLLGPAQNYIAKLNGTYRWQIILKGKNEQIRPLLKEFINIKLPPKTHINLELNPTDLL